MPVSRLPIAMLLLLVALQPARSFAADAALIAHPAEVKLQGNFARAQLVVVEADSSSGAQVTRKSNDISSLAKYESSDPAVVTVSAAGQLRAMKDGKAKIKVSQGSRTIEVPVTVAGIVEQPDVQYLEQIRPILAKNGCAMAACHAAQHGQGGFKLSVFGFEPDKDREAMVRDSIGRRVSLVDPEQSLMLLKPTMQTPHGGGRRLEKDSVDYQMLVAWIQGGAAKPAKTENAVTKLHVFPKERLGQVGMSQQLRVEAEYADGQRHDVTHWAKFDSLDDGVASVTRDGLVTTIGKGQGGVMVRFEGQADTTLFVIPYAETVELADWKDNNDIDKLAVTKFRELGIEPSPLCDDATFLRRASLDSIGTLPSPEETRAFIDSQDPDKRKKLVDRLLGLTGDPAQDIYNDAYAAYWSLKWSDLLRNTSASLGEQGMWSMHNWIRESFRTNKPFDGFVRELITARGSLYSVGPANYFRIHRDSSALAESTAQLFLGVRMECAKCHHHPFEKYSQEDYYGLAAFFSRVGTKTSEEFGLFGGEQVVVVRDTGDVKHPRTNALMKPKALEAAEMEHPLDRRMPLADWLTSKDNAYFANNVVNRYVAYLLGRGLVEPVDDLRSTNPPSNPALMEALSKKFVESNFNLKHLMREIMNSRLYQLDSQPTKSNAADTVFYSHFAVKRLTAEPLVDALDRVTLVQTKYKNLPLGTRAIELPDAEYADYFLATFGKPKRVSVCECERPLDPSLAQALHTLNGDTLASKISDKQGRIAKLIKAKKSPAEIVEEIYLATLNRLPSAAERTQAEEFLTEHDNAEEVYQDLLWAIINSKQFLFIH
ncbi:Bacterial Ig-like domain (group 2) [Anatilimnocola aggregata]|uniref:Bacterial Ig-like domain (Group 2) n=1 Tax=Anatilimnocola aggregata TaxID=2528021 RepID=A0A517YNY9_9BACT|nr:DUF1549 domain-containing protein [Anatilimnocola aggregata]QDU31919.1 Bacterial Ig-like domain (group 2) [Anatilimnocola aggregata]